MEDVLDQPDEPNPKKSEPGPVSETAPQETFVRTPPTIDELRTTISTGDPRRAARASFDLAKLLFERGELDAALSRYQAIWESGDPQQAPDAALLLVALSATKGSYKLATEALKSVQDSPDDTVRRKAQEIREQLEASIRSIA